MFITLGDVSIELVSNDTRIKKSWRLQFGDFIKPQATKTDLRMVAHFVNVLPSLPTIEPYYIDQREDVYGNAASILQAFRCPDGSIVLHFFDGALVTIPAQIDGSVAAEAWLTAEILVNGQIEDVTLVSLQPLLRHFGCFLIHASGASFNGQAVLFVGGSGSGKTTTCLNLVLHGWQMLANDVVLVKQQSDGVYAYPVPDNLTIRPKTRTLLPQLNSFIKNSVGEISFPAQKLVQGNWSKPARITAVCFPQVADQSETTSSPQMQAIALAIMMQESIDRWDADAMQSHTDILEAICRQADRHTLTLGSDLAAQGNVIQSIL